jgi:hypothetical protein
MSLFRGILLIMSKLRENCYEVDFWISPKGSRARGLAKSMNRRNSHCKHYRMLLSFLYCRHCLFFPLKILNTTTPPTDKVAPTRARNVGFFSLP